MSNNGTESKNERGFWISWRGLFPEDWTPSMKLVYPNIMAYANGSGVCNATHETLAKDASLSFSAVRDSIRDLIECGYIKSKRGRYGKEYEIVQNELSEAIQIVQKRLSEAKQIVQNERSDRSKKPVRSFKMNGRKKEESKEENNTLSKDRGALKSAPLSKPNGSSGKLDATRDKLANTKVSKPKPKYYIAAQALAKVIGWNWDTISSQEKGRLIRDIKRLSKLYKWYDPYEAKYWTELASIINKAYGQEGLWYEDVKRSNMTWPAGSGNKPTIDQVFKQWNVDWIVPD